MKLSNISSAESAVAASNRSAGMKVASGYRCQREISSMQKQ
jgi:hypothetical protein